MHIAVGSPLELQTRNHATFTKTMSAQFNEMSTSEARVQSILEELRSNDHFDAHIICSNGTIGIHSLVLVAVSKSFKSILESIQDTDLLCISIPDLDVERVKVFFDHLLGSCQSQDRVSVESSVLELLDLDIEPIREEKRRVPIKVQSRRPNVKRSFTCDKCGKELCSSYSLLLHQRVHKQSRPFKCQECDKSFSQKSHLTVHRRVHTGEKPHLCPKCGRCFAVVSNMKKHLAGHDQAKKGSQIQEDESGEQALITHKCKECQDSFLTKLELINHKSQAHPTMLTTTQTKGQSFACSVCHRACSTRSALEKHELVHTGTKPFQCDICKKCFVQKSQLNHHKRTVHASNEDLNNRKYVCSDCGHRFATSSSLKKHCQTHKDSSQWPFACHFCNRRFIQKTHLETHLSQHTGQSQFLCGTCGKSFTTNSNLKNHLKLHTGERKLHPCSECEAKYANLADLKIHYMKHTGEMPYQCSVCPKRFRAKRHLEEHHRTHSGHKPFQCHNCNRSFASSGGLRLHFKRNDTCKLAASSGAFSIARVDLLLDEVVEATSGSNFVTDHTGLVDLAPDLINNPSDMLSDPSLLLQPDPSSVLMDQDHQQDAS